MTSTNLLPHLITRLTIDNCAATADAPVDGRAADVVATTTTPATVAADETLIC